MRNYISVYAAEGCKIIHVVMFYHYRLCQIEPKMHRSVRKISVSAVGTA